MGWCILFQTSSHIQSLCPSGYVSARDIEVRGYFNFVFEFMFALYSMRQLSDSEVLASFILLNDKGRSGR